MKPEYDAGKNLKEQMESVVALYDSEMSLQAIGEELGLNPIKVYSFTMVAPPSKPACFKRSNTTEEFLTPWRSKLSNRPVDIAWKNDPARLVQIAGYPLDNRPSAVQFIEIFSNYIQRNYLEERILT